MHEVRLYVLQRLTALIMAPMIIAHLVTILYATRAGLTAEAILARVHSAPWIPLFYALFVVTVSIHAPLGLRKIFIEWCGVSDKAANRLAVAIFTLFLVMGLRGVWAVMRGVI